MPYYGISCYDRAIELDDEFEELVALQLHDHVLEEHHARNIVAQRKGFDNSHDFKKWIQHLKARKDALIGGGVLK